MQARSDGTVSVGGTLPALPPPVLEHGHVEGPTTPIPDPPSPQVAMAECTELEWAVQVLVNNFDKYSSRRCCCKKPRRISKKEFRKMLSCELNHMLTVRPGRAGPAPPACKGSPPTPHPAFPTVPV